MQGKIARMKATTQRCAAQCALVIALVAALIASPVLTLPAAAAETPPRLPEATQEAQQTWQQVRGTLNQITYVDLVRYSAPYIRFSDQAPARAELIAEGNSSPTQEQIRERILHHYGDYLNLEREFDALKAELDTVMPKLITLAQKQGGNISSLQNDPHAFLLGLAYMRHYYAFKFADVPTYELMLADPNGRNPLVRLTYIGQSGYTALQAFSTWDTYERRIAVDTGFNSLTGFIKSLINEYEPGVAPNDWLKANSKAIIVEQGPVSLFEKHERYPELRRYFLSLFALEGSDIYVGNIEHSVQYGLTSTYDMDEAGLRALISDTLTEETAFWDFWKRISTTADVLKTHQHTVVFDTPRRSSQYGNLAAQQWSPRRGAGTDPGVRDFYTPLLIWQDYSRVEAYATDANIIFRAKKALGQSGVNTYSHEATHIYEDKIWFNGESVRTNVGPEIYARGIFETENNTQPEFGGHTQYEPLMNLNTAYELGENRVQNASPTRFQTPADIQQYMQGLMDVMYSLDAMEALSALKLPDGLKEHAFTRVVQTTDSAPIGDSVTLDTFEYVSAADLAGITDMNGVVDANLVSGRLVPKGVSPVQTLPRNEYASLPLYEPIYAGAQNNSGTVGGLTFRRNAHELLAEYGWDKGFVGYLSGRYPNDAVALADIAAADGGTMASFKKAMFERRVKRFNDMKPAGGFTTAAQMQKAMDQAVAADTQRLKDNKAAYGQQPGAPLTLGVSAVRALKDRIFRSYLTQTNDFRSSIYQEREGKVTQELQATVQLTSEDQPREFADGDFTFTIAGTNDASTAVKGLPTTSVAASNDGNIPLGTLEFTAPGTYTYSVTQNIGTNNKITYDRETAKVVIDVEWASESTDPQAAQELQRAGKDILRIKNVTWTKADIAANPPVIFRNLYTPERTQSEKVEEIAIPIEEEIILNKDVLAGTPDKILSEGKAGVITKRTVTKYVDGVQDGDPIITETETTPMEKRRIERGSKALPLEPAPTPQREDTPEAIAHEFATLFPLTANGKNYAYKDDALILTLTLVDPAQIEAVQGLPTQAITVPADGQVSWGTLTFTKAGTYDFTITQKTNPNAQVQVNTPEVTLKVVVAQRLQDGVPVLFVEKVTYLNGDRELSDASIPNTYLPIRATETQTRDVIIPIEDKIIDDPNMLITAPQRIDFAGETGLKTITTIQRTIDGEPEGEPTVTEEVKTEMKPRIIVRGSKPLPAVPQPQPTPTPPSMPGAPDPIDVPAPSTPSVPEEPPTPLAPTPQVVPTPAGETPRVQAPAQKALAATGFNDLEMLLTAAGIAIAGLVLMRGKRTTR